jgi:hypothetical protein
MTVQTQNFMVNKILVTLVCFLVSISLYGQGRFLWDNPKDESRILLYYPADTGSINTTWEDTRTEAHLTSPDAITQVSGADNFYIAPYTGEPRYAVQVDSTVLYNKGDFIYTGDSLSVYFALRLWEDQENTVARLIGLVDTAGTVGDHNSLSIWLHNNRLQVSSNGKLVSGSSKFLQYKVWLVEVHVNQRGATIVLDGDTLHHNKEFVPYNFNINGVMIGADYDYTNFTNYVNNAHFGDIVVAEGPIDWMREKFNSKYHAYMDIAYESLTSIADSHPVGLYVNLGKLDYARFRFLNDGRHTQGDYYFGLWDTIFSSDIVGMKWYWQTNHNGYNYYEDGPFETTFFQGQWFATANTSTSWYQNYKLDTSLYNATSYTMLNEYGMAFADNNPQSQIWPNGIYWYEDNDGATVPNYTHSNSTGRYASPIQDVDFFDLQYDSTHISGWAGQYYDGGNTTTRIYHNKVSVPLEMAGVTVSSGSYGGGYWWTRSTANNLKWPARWIRTVGFYGQMKWEEANYLMHNWDRIDFTNQVDKPVSESFIHEYEASPDYITVISDTLRVWEDLEGRIDIVDTTGVGFDVRAIKPATYDTINNVVQCRETTTPYIPFDSCWQYKNVNIYVVMEDLSTGTDSSWIGLIHRNNTNGNNHAFVRWGVRNSVGFGFTWYSGGTSTYYSDAFKAAHFNYYDPEYFPRWNVTYQGNDAGINRYRITIDDNRFRGSDIINDDTIANRKQIMMFESVNTLGMAGFSLNYDSNNNNGNYDIKHIIITHGEENPKRVFSYLRDKYDGWLDDRYEPGVLDPNAEDYLVSYDISELIDTNQYPVKTYFKFEDVTRDHVANGQRMATIFDRVRGITATNTFGGNNDYYQRSTGRTMLGQTVPALTYNTSKYSFGSWKEGTIPDTSFTMLWAMRGYNFATTNVNGYMGMHTDDANVGFWWDTHGSTTDGTRLELNNGSRWSWTPADDTIGVVGFSHDISGAIKGVRYLAGFNTTTWFQKNYNTASVGAITYDPSAYDITMSGDFRGGSGSADVDYLDKFIVLKGALGETDLKNITRFYPKLRIDQYPLRFDTNIPNDLQGNVLAVWDAEYGRRQQRSSGIYEPRVRYWYDQSDNAWLRNDTEADRPLADKFGGLIGDNSNHMDFSTNPLDITDVGDFSMFTVAEVHSGSVNCDYIVEITTGSATNGTDVFTNMSLSSTDLYHAAHPAVTLRDESSVQSMVSGVEIPYDTKVLFGFRADEDGQSLMWVNGMPVDALYPDGGWHGAGGSSTLMMERYANCILDGKVHHLSIFDKALSDDEARRLQDSIMSAYDLEPISKTIELSYDPLFILQGDRLYRDANGVFRMEDMDFADEIDYQLEQATDASKPGYNNTDKAISFERSKYMEFGTHPFTNEADSVFTTVMVIEPDSIYTDWNQTRTMVYSDGDNYYAQFGWQYAALSGNDYLHLSTQIVDDHPNSGGPSLWYRYHPMDEPVLITVRASETRGIDMWINGYLVDQKDIEIPGWDGIAGNLFHGVNKKRNSSDYWGDWDLYFLAQWPDYLTDDQIRVIHGEVVGQLKLPDLDTAITQFEEDTWSISDSIDNQLYVTWEFGGPYLTTTSGTYPYASQAWTDLAVNSMLSPMAYTDAHYNNLNLSGSGAQIWTYGGRKERYVPLFNAGDDYTMDGTFDFPDTTTIVMRWRNKSSAQCYGVSQYTASNATTSIYTSSNHSLNMVCNDVFYDTGIDLERDTVFYIAWTLGGDQMHWDVVKMVGAIEGASPSRYNPQDWGSGSHTFASSAPTIDRLIINGYNSSAGNPSNSNFTPMEYIMVFEGKLDHDEFRYLINGIENLKLLRR